MTQSGDGARKLLHTGMIAVLVAGALACSSARSPEEFCAHWVDSTCSAVSSCCAGGNQFDLEACRSELWSSCLQQIPVEQVHSGEVVFDPHAAGACVGEVTTCTDLTTSQTTYEHQRACGTMLTGFRPLGAPCSASSDCQKHGDFAHCYSGIDGTGGICVKPRLSDDLGCGFSFATMELRMCPDGMFCDMSSLKPDSSKPPSVQEYEFSVSCEPYLVAGAVCTTLTGTLTCGEGLYCANTQGVCTAYAAQGESCAAGEECAPGLECTTVQTAATCEPSASYCYHPGVCGDGVCDTGEWQTCMRDCGGTCLSSGDFCAQPADCCSWACNGGMCA